MTSCVTECLFRTILPLLVWLFGIDKGSHNRGGRLLRHGAAGEGPRRGRGYYQLRTRLERTGDRKTGDQDQ